MEIEPDRGDEAELAETVKETVPLAEPEPEVMVMNSGLFETAVQLHPAGAVTENEEFEAAAGSESDDADREAGQEEVIVKFELEISKKMLLMASTFNRAEEEGELGTVKECDPSLGVELAITIGNESPPSVEREILTEEQDTGGAEVEATSQEID